MNIEHSSETTYRPKWARGGGGGGFNKVRIASKPFLKCVDVSKFVSVFLMSVVCRLGFGVKRCDVGLLDGCDWVILIRDCLIIVLNNNLFNIFIEIYIKNSFLCYVI